jgi:gliding motility-associated-like protein
MLRYFLTLLCCLLSTLLFAQLRADFVMDKPSGCSPLVINFTNTSTGAGASAVWEWSFDNGNIADVKNPSAIFMDERTYTITLKVTDGTRTATQTKTITVHKSPAIDFTVQPAVTCLPDPTTFTASSDISMTRWHWDFGNGRTQVAYSNTTIHYYEREQTATVSLTGVSNMGCSKTIVKENILTIKRELKPDFTGDKLVYCEDEGTVNFTDKSTGPGTFTYLWNFGDGNTSTAANPSHHYTREGLYTVSLTITNEDGCRKTFTRNNYINIGFYKTDFDVPALICESASATFINRSNPTPTYSRWYVNNVLVSNWYVTSFNHTFTTPGTYQVRLENEFGPCGESITKTVEVKARPVLTGFIIDTVGKCGAPALFNFKDTTATAVQWDWNFNYDYYNAPRASTQTPSHTFAADGYYWINLRVTNRDGCTSTTNKTLSISKPLVGIYIASGNGSRGCAPYTTKLEYRTTEAFASYTWNFGNGQTSTDASPSITYNTPGNYIVSLNYTTLNGCTGTATYSIVNVYQKPVANFSLQPTVCGNTPVFFSNQTTGYFEQLRWNFGDGSMNGSSLHKYETEGTYDVQLIAYNGMCNDTIRKPAIIKVAPPFPKITGAENTCDGDRGLVTLTDGSKQTNTWHWDFGGVGATAYTTAQPRISYRFATTGVHKVVLTNTNGACTVKDSVNVTVLMKQKPVLTFDKDITCVNQPIRYTINNLEDNPFADNNTWNSDYSIVKFEYEDGTQVPEYTLDNFRFYTTASGQLTTRNPKQGRIRAIIRSSVANCLDTTNFASLHTTGAVVGYEVLSDKHCFKSPVTLNDTSKTLSNNPIVRWVWNMGDGNNVTQTSKAPNTYIFNRPGLFNVNLTVQDASGCQSYTNNFSRWVEVHGTKAGFYTSTGTTVNVNTVVNYYNSSQSYNAGTVNYEWLLGDGTTVTTNSASETFTRPGQYTVRLIAKSLNNTCLDTVSTVITVRPPNPVFVTNTSIIGNNSKCPPVNASFYYNSSANYTKLEWDFGDGFKMDNLTSLSHIYTKPGKYVVRLNVYYNATMFNQYTDTVVVAQPETTLDIDKKVICINETVKLFTTSPKNNYSYTWDLGAGNLQSSNDTVVTLQYTKAGSYQPVLMLTGENGCTVAAKLAQPVVVNPNPVISITPTNPIYCKTNAVQLTASGGVNYSWSPAAGLSNLLIGNPFASPANTTTYKVEAIDAAGCKGQGETTVIVPKPFTMQTKKLIEVCYGEKATPIVTGAATYQWINHTAGVSNLQSPTPVIATFTNASYTVVGTDQYGCYTDTAVIDIVVRPLPWVKAGEDIRSIYGADNQLAITNSADVMKWTWTPAEFLSCTDCANPVTRPYGNTSYVITVQNQYQCIAKDTLNVVAFCGADNIQFPNAFTPNNDSKNDVFMAMGTGVNKIKSFKIFNRWGDIVFFKRDIFPDDKSSAWDGKYKGVEAPTGTYVYFVELECAAGGSYEKKGTVTLIR